MMNIYTALFHTGRCFALLWQNYLTLRSFRGLIQSEKLCAFISGSAYICVVF